MGPGNEKEVGDTAIRAAAQTAMMPSGTLLAGRYRVRELLAQGGMGEVYRAEHAELGRPFAVKVMKPELAGSADFVDRFRREAIACSRIGHPNIIDIVDFGRTDEGLFYFAMELLDGRTLAQLIAAEGAQSVMRVRKIIAQVCHGLAAAHALGIVHRDLKPENVMLVQRPGLPDQVKILDFGIAKVSGGLASGGQTAFGLVVGTPQYMSPEQASGLGIDLRTDIYSLGLIVYELLTGRPTFEGSTPSLLIAKHVAEPPPPMTPGPIEPIPHGLRSLIFRMLAKRPEQRPESMGEVLQGLGLEGVLPLSVAPVAVPVKESPSTKVLPASSLPRQPTPRPTQRSPVVVVVQPRARWPWAVAIALVVGIGGGAWMRKRPAPVPAEQPLLVEPPPPMHAPSVRAPSLIPSGVEGSGQRPTAEAVRDPSVRAPSLIPSGLEGSGERPTPSSGEAVRNPAPRTPTSGVDGRGPRPKPASSAGAQPSRLPKPKGVGQPARAPDELKDSYSEDLKEIP